MIHLLCVLHAESVSLFLQSLQWANCLITSDAAEVGRFSTNDSIMGWYELQNHLFHLLRINPRARI